MKACRLVAPWSFLALSFVSAHADQGPRVSKFGEYQGYSPSRYDSFLRESVYITVKDGTRIAVDIFRPATAGVVASERLPVALNVTRYWRSSELEDGSIATMPGLIEAGKKGGQLLDPAEYRSERGSAVMASELLRHGYIIIAMDSRGTGASFGVQTPLLATEADDMRQVIEWSAAQPWSTDKVGMFGASWPGIIQLIAVMAKPAKLAAIFPSVPNFPDFYRIFRSGGVFGKGAALTMRKTLVGLSEVKDQGQTGSTYGRVRAGKRVVGVARVDLDEDGKMRESARAAQGAASFRGYIDAVVEHPVIKEAVAELGLKTMDEILDTLFDAAALDRTLKGHDALRSKLAAAQWPQPVQSFDLVKDWVGRMNAARIPTYLWDGWQDPAPNERLLYFYNLTVPRRITIGPWSHGPGEPNDPREDAHVKLMGTELVRWFDFWLKGIANGIDKEPPVHYAVMQDKAHWEWRTAETIPPKEAKDTDFFFAAGPSGSVPSTNDGLLVGGKPSQSGASDAYTADYSLTTGNHTRLHDATGAGPIDYPELAPHDAKALTYTTAPLVQDVAFAGFPVITLHVSSTSKDPSLAVYLEDVDPEGHSTLVSQGFMRASHRTGWQPPYSTNGAPWTSSRSMDVDAAVPLTSGPAQIRFSLQPAANRFVKGHRIRVSIATSDEGVIWVIPEDPRPVLTVWRDPERPSRLTLPALPNGS